MYRRVFIAILGLLAGRAVRPAGALTIAPPLSYWARELYQRETQRQNDRQAGPDEAELLALFTPKLQALWRAGQRRPAFVAPAGPILNVFFGWGVLPGHSVALDAVNDVSGSGALAAADIAFRLRGEARSLRLQGIRAGLGWQIDDIVYDHGESFAAYRRRLAGK